MTFGVKSHLDEGGVRGTMGDAAAGGASPTKAPAAATRRDIQAPLGQHRPTYVKDAETRVFGAKSLGNEGGVAATLAAPQGGELPSEAKAPVGKHRPTERAGADDRVYGTHPKDQSGSVASTFASLTIGASPRSLAPVGRARTPTVPNLASRTFGVSTSKRDDSAGEGGRWVGGGGCGDDDDDADL